MFFYDKDMERMMQLKKQEIMHEMEAAKKRILKELLCVKRSVHTDMGDLLADYNRIDFAMKKLVADFKVEIKKVTDEYSGLISQKFEEYNDVIEDKLTALEIFEREVVQTFNNKLAELEAMQATVAAAIARLEELAANGVTQDELQNAITNNNTEINNSINVFKNEINVTIESILAKMENAGVQSDWNVGDPANKAHVLNRTHYGTNSETEELYNGAFSELRNDVDYDSALSACRYFEIPLDVSAIKPGDLVEFNFIDRNYVKPVYVGCLVNKKHINDENTAFQEIPMDNVVYIGNPEYRYNLPYAQVTFEEGIFAYIVPGADKLTVVLYENDASIIPTSVTISVKKFNAEKLLDPAYVGKNGNYGKVLSYGYPAATWEELPLVKYRKIEVTENVTCKFLYESGAGEYWVYFKAPNVKPLNIPESGFFKVNDFMFPYEIKNNQVRLFRSSQCYLNINSNYELLSISTSELFTVAPNYQTEGITITFLSFEEVIFGGTLTPEFIAPNFGDYMYPVAMGEALEWANAPFVIAPNRAVYAITVADDGTLSTTLIREAPTTE